LGGFMTTFGRTFSGRGGLDNLIAYGAGRNLQTFDNYQYHPAIHRFRCW
jgi:hypothetical protein